MGKRPRDALAQAPSAASSATAAATAPHHKKKPKKGADAPDVAAIASAGRASIVPLDYATQRASAIALMERLLSGATSTPSNMSARGLTATDGFSRLPSSVAMHLLQAADGTPHIAKRMRDGVHAGATPDLALPRHLRRRTMAHRRYRMPVLLRAAPMRAKLAIPEALRVREHRRKLSLMRERWRHAADAALSQAIGGAVGAPRGPQTDVVSSVEPVRRLQTHAWHSKRFAMSEQWGHLVANHRRDISTDTAARWFQAGATLMHDASYWVALRITVSVCNATGASRVRSTSATAVLMESLKLLAARPVASVASPHSRGGSVGGEVSDAGAADGTVRSAPAMVGAEAGATLTRSQRARQRRSKARASFRAASENAHAETIISDVGHRIAGVDESVDAANIPFATRAALRGEVEAAWLMHGPGAFPAGLLGPVRSLWLASDALEGPDLVRRCADDSAGQHASILLWTHAAALAEVSQAVRDALAATLPSDSSASSDVEVAPLCRFSIIGARAATGVAAALQRDPGAVNAVAGMTDGPATSTSVGASTNGLMGLGVRLRRLARSGGMGAIASEAVDFNCRSSEPCRLPPSLSKASLLALDSAWRASCSTDARSASPRPAPVASGALLSMDVSFAHVRGGGPSMAATDVRRWRRVAPRDSPRPMTAAPATAAATTTPVAVSHKLQSLPLSAAGAASSAPPKRHILVPLIFTSPSVAISPLSRDTQQFYGPAVVAEDNLISPAIPPARDARASPRAAAAHWQGCRGESAAPSFDIIVPSVVARSLWQRLATAPCPTSALQESSRPRRRANAGGGFRAVGLDELRAITATAGSPSAFPSDFPDSVVAARLALAVAQNAYNDFALRPRHSRVPYSALRSPAPFGPLWEMLWPEREAAVSGATRLDGYTAAAAPGARCVVVVRDPAFAAPFFNADDGEDCGDEDARVDDGMSDVPTTVGDHAVSTSSAADNVTLAFGPSNARHAVFKALAVATAAAPALPPTISEAYDVLLAARVALWRRGGALPHGTMLLLPADEDFRTLAGGQCKSCGPRAAAASAEGALLTELLPTYDESHAPSPAAVSAALLALAPHPTTCSWCRDGFVEPPGAPYAWPPKRNDAHPKASKAPNSPLTTESRETSRSTVLPRVLRRPTEDGDLSLDDYLHNVLWPAVAVSPPTRRIVGFVTTGVPRGGGAVAASAFKAGTALPWSGLGFIRADAARALHRYHSTELGRAATSVLLRAFARAPSSAQLRPVLLQVDVVGLVE